MQFIKMHGTGNDFIVLDCMRGGAPADPGAIARRLCRRHYSVGADGLVLILPSSAADARMRIFNPDGSEAEMCGNAIRCVGKFLYENDRAFRSDIRVETAAGIKPLHIHAFEGVVQRVTVDMGVPSLNTAVIPMDSKSNQVTLSLDGRDVRFFCVSMTYPHAVTFDMFPGDDDFRRLSALVENHPVFPRKTNVEFCRADGRERAFVRVWEQGVGPVLASGTGACAALAAGNCLGLLERGAELVLPGGALQLRWGENGHVFLTGDAAVAYVGEAEA